MATGFTDFGSAPTGSPPSGFSFVDMSLFITDFPTPNVEARAGSLSGRAVEMVSTDNAWVTAVWDDADAFADGEVVVLVDVGNWSINGGACGRSDGTGDGGGTNVASYVRPTNDDLRVGYRDAAEGVTAIGSDDKGTVDADERWWVRLNFDGTTLKSKAWKDGDTEPASWDVDATDAGVVTASGKPGFECRTQTGSSRTMWLEAIGWSDNPTVSAPTEAASGGAETPRGRSRSRRVGGGPGVWGRFRERVSGLLVPDRTILVPVGVGL